ncbi:putative mfs transporter [Erysiphe necator]|uniref:Putative mfs transporter n=1 Tax=Uncinula necator TaxID=52586 RepID=A0A0B1NV84_UNCNE|nr:putative mfs transporter [Erysiphe necator]
MLRKISSDNINMEMKNLKTRGLYGQQQLPPNIVPPSMPTTMPAIYAKPYKSPLDSPPPPRTPPHKKEPNGDWNDINAQSDMASNKFSCGHDQAKANPDIHQFLTTSDIQQHGRKYSIPDDNTNPYPSSPIGQASPGRSTYSEKDGLRAHSESVERYNYINNNLRFIMTILACAFSLAGSQIVGLLYLTLGTRIAEDLNRPDLTIWLLSAGIIAMGALAPFVGPIADLYGRKPILLSGVLCAIIGAIVCAATPTAGGFIAGQTLLGFGAVIEELMAISIVSEVVPTAKRGLYAALILTAILPWSPGTLYADFISSSSWRWIGIPLALWHVLIFFMVVGFYFPPPRVNARGLSRIQLLNRIDWLGGFFLTLGLLLILIAMNWGGQQYAWSSSHVVSFLIAGFFLLIAFVAWEFFGAEYPLYPRRILHAPRPFLCILFVIFSAGINFIPLVVFWPIESISVYGSDMRQSGINSLPIGMCILAGGIISALLVALFKPRVTLIMTFFCILQTCGAGTLAVVDPHSLRTVWAPLCLALIGVGGVLVPNQVIITILTPDDLIASATALTVGLRSQAQVIGLAIYYSRFLHVLERQALKHLAAPIVSAGIFNITVITDLVVGLASRPFDQLGPAVPQLSGPAHALAYQAVKEGALMTYKGAFDYVYLMSIGFGIAASIAAASMGNIEKYIDEHVAVVLE